MSIELVKIEMLKFIMDPRPLVLCIRGKWGTGKSFAWAEALKKARIQQMPMSKYAYVSLFGMKDSADILQSAYVNTNDLTVTDLDVRLTQSTGVTRNGIVTKMKKLTDAFSKHASVPHVSGLGGLARAVMANLVQKSIICIDDIERKGPGLTANEIMGIAAQLRDVRECKVVLILNENSLDDASRNEFERYAEKVIDMSFVFAPTPKEAVIIALPDQDDFSNRLRDACEELEITNIRVLNKIAFYARELMELMGEIQPEVTYRVLRSFVVVARSIFSPAGEGAPDIEYLLEKRRHQYYGSKNDTFTDAESAWGAQLTSYGFTTCDEFDRTIIDGLKCGYFDEERIREHIDKYLKDAHRSRATKEIDDAWTLARRSFDSNEDVVAEAVYNASITHIAYVNTSTLNNTVALLKDIGHPDKAMGLLNKFVAAHADKDIFRHRGFGEPADPDLVKAFDLQVSKQPPRDIRTPIDAAKRIHSGSWSPEDEAILRNLSVEEFETLFRSTPDDERPSFIYGALRFFNNTGATEEQLKISDRAREALIRIGNDGPMNRFRIRALGIHIEDAKNNKAQEPIKT